MASSKPLCFASSRLCRCLMGLNQPTLFRTIPLVAKLGDNRTVFSRNIISHSSHRLMSSATSTSLEAALSEAVSDVDSPTTSQTLSSSSSDDQNPRSSLLTHDDLSKVKCGRLSKLFLPYLSSLPSRGAVQDDSKNFRLLLNNGFIFPSAQGMFHMLPLGVRVMDKLKRIVVEELEDAGCQVCFHGLFVHYEF